MEKLPSAECRLGYPDSQLEEILGEERLKDFYRWMRGQTFSACDGTEYNHQTRKYEPSVCSVSHGYVYYRQDVERFLAGKPVID